MPLPTGTSIHIFRTPYFLASKLEAFTGRGRKDWLASKDIEDVVAVLDGRRGVADELAHAEAGVRGYLAREFRSFLRRHDHEEIVHAHLPGDAVANERARRIIALIAALVNGSG